MCFIRWIISKYIKFEYLLIYPFLTYTKLTPAPAPKLTCTKSWFGFHRKKVSSRASFSTRPPGAPLNKLLLQLQLLESNQYFPNEYMLSHV